MVNIRGKTKANMLILKKWSNFMPVCKAIIFYFFIVINYSYFCRSISKNQNKNGTGRYFQKVSCTL